MPTSLQQIKRHQANLRRCTRCTEMLGPPVTGQPVISKVVLVGQAPGPKEIEVHKPFAWTAGKTLFKWFDSIGLDEDQFRSHVYMAAVCRCFPGKNPRGGDRVPDPIEITHCSGWLKKELTLLQPELIIPTGKLAIAQLMEVKRLNDVVGAQHRVSLHGVTCDSIPLPHPSGASTWHRTEPGKSMLNKALKLIKRHHAWREITRQITG